jgi:hypothetical protein
MRTTIGIERDVARKGAGNPYQRGGSKSLGSSRGLHAGETWGLSVWGWIVQSISAEPTTCNMQGETQSTLELSVLPSHYGNYEKVGGYGKPKSERLSRSRGPAWSSRMTVSCVNYIFMPMI